MFHFCPRQTCSSVFSVFSPVLTSYSKVTKQATRIPVTLLISEADTGAKTQMKSLVGQFLGSPFIQSARWIFKLTCKYWFSLWFLCFLECLLITSSCLTCRETTRSEQHHAIRLVSVWFLNISANMWILKEAQTPTQNIRPRVNSV